jgi:hypothetical protein
LELFHLKTLPEFEHFLFVATDIALGLRSSLDWKLFIEQNGAQ